MFSHLNSFFVTVFIFKKDCPCVVSCFYHYLLSVRRTDDQSLSNGRYYFGFFFFSVLSSLCVCYILISNSNGCGSSSSFWKSPLAKQRKCNECSNQTVSQWSLQLVNFNGLHSEQSLLVVWQTTTAKVNWRWRQEQNSQFDAVLAHWLHNKRKMLNWFSLNYKQQQQLYYYKMLKNQFSELHQQAEAP